MSNDRVIPPQPLRDDSVKAAYSAQPGAGTEPPFTRDKTPQRPAQRLMGFTEAIVTCLKKYATFKGRATRAEFWWFRLFVFLVGFVVGFFGGAFPKMAHSSFVLYLLFWLAIFLPDCAVTVRRLHDRNHTGWWLLLFGILAILVPLIVGTMYLVFSGDGTYSVSIAATSGLILLSLLLYQLCMPSGPDNKYGEVPCMADEDDPPNDDLS